jgi:hypothetical protein
MKPMVDHQRDTEFTNATGLFYWPCDNAYFINSSCILSNDKIVHIGGRYILLKDPGTSKIKLAAVTIKRVFHYSEFVFLYLMDILTGTEFWIYILLKSGKENCTFVIIEPDFFIERMQKRNTSPFLKDDLLKFIF